MFASTYIDMVEDDFSLLGSSGNIGITTEDGSWLFDQPSGYHQKNPDWIITPEFKAGVLLAISQLTKASNVTVELMLSVPYETGTLRKDAIRKMLNNLRGEHTIKALNNTKQHITIEFPQKSYVVGQHIAPVLRHVISSIGNVKLPTNKKNEIYIGVVNGGAQTVELSTVKITVHNNGQPPNFDPYGGKSEGEGMYQLADALRPKLQQEFPRFITLFNDDSEMFDIIVNEKIQAGSLDIDVKDIVRPEKERYCQKNIISICDNEWGSQKSRVNKNQVYEFIAAGGGANVFLDTLQGWHHMVVASDNPQFDVVEGMRRLRKMLDKEMS